MTTTLADFWPILCPTLPAVWDTPANRKKLTQLTHWMAPIPRIGLECRLGNVTAPLDLQQCISRDNSEPALLRDFIRATQPTALESASAWARLQRFCTVWADPTTVLHQGIAEVFLEYDLDTDPQPALMPSLFFAIGETGTTPAASEAIAQAALMLLLPTPWLSGLADNLARCFAACPPGAYIGYLGAMLGRTTQGVRVNIKRLRLDDLVPFLRAVGWSGPLIKVEAWAAWAYDRVDRITVCLDVGKAIYPQLGLECMLTLQPLAEPRWQALLEELSAAGLCTAENAVAFLSLPDVLHPSATQTDWPAAWIAATLCAPTDYFSTTERQLSHLKLTITAQNVLLKGYWGAGHVWRKLSPQGEVVHERQSLPRFVQEYPAEIQVRLASGTPNRSVEQAVTQAITFLLSQQAQTGRWHDFLLPAGPSDEWVTAFVAACLLETESEIAYAAAKLAWQALCSRRRDEPGWGYNRLTPADADSTAWALRLATSLGIPQDERVSAARHFLAGHLLADGGIMTYAAHDPIRRYTRLPVDASFAGWQAAHVCVTAAAAPNVDTSVIGYLASQQTTAGHWQGYWWWDDEYTTALATEALAATRTRTVAQAVVWAQNRVSVTGAVHRIDGVPSPWATAWCVRILRLGTTPAAQTACAQAVAWLLNAQQQDGGWASSARLRVPMPGQLDTKRQAKWINSFDQNRVFTTAAVTAALGLSAGVTPQST